VYDVLCAVLLFQNIYAHKNWRIRRNTKKIWIKKGLEEGENEGVKDGKKKRVNPLALELYIYSLAHHLCKMYFINQEG